MKVTFKLDILLFVAELAVVAVFDELEEEEEEDVGFKFHRKIECPTCLRKIGILNFASFFENI